MKLAIMQPYFLPYIGYFQLINAVDTFVLLDDVNYINKGWINRNQLLLNGKAHLFTLPLQKASQNKLINQLELSNETKWKDKLLKTIETAYKKAPQFHLVFPLISQILQYPESNLSLFIHHSIQKHYNSLIFKKKKNIIASPTTPKSPSQSPRTNFRYMCCFTYPNLYQSYLRHRIIR